MRRYAVLFLCILEFISATRGWQSNLQSRVLLANSRTSHKMPLVNPPAQYLYIIVTPAGRRSDSKLRLLHKALLGQKDAFDEWHLWVNTQDAEDIKYMEQLAAENTWIVLKTLDAQEAARGNDVGKFFKFCSDPRAIYLRLDDDIVWMEPEFVQRIFHYRVMHPEPFLVYANIINNDLTTYIHQHLGNVPFPRGVFGHGADISGDWAGFLHRTFIRSVMDGHLNRWHFGQWVLAGYEGMSVNAVAFRGADFAVFGGIVRGDEEPVLSVDKPRDLKRPSVVFGGAVCVRLGAADLEFGSAFQHNNTPDLMSHYAQLHVDPSAHKRHSPTLFA